MLEITAGQWAEAARGARRNFAAAYGPLLAAAFPDLAVHHDWWAEALDRAVEEALRYGIESDRAVLRFVELRLTYGPGFPAAPAWEWARAILEAAPPTGDHKIERIDAVVCGGPLW